MKSKSGFTGHSIGTTMVTVVDGIATFEDITFVAEPGSSDEQFSITSNALDEAMLARVYGDDFE